MKTEILTCDCGGQVSKQNGKGKYFSAAQYGKVLLTQKHMIEICDSCDAVYRNAGDHSLQEKLMASITDNVIDLIKHASATHGLKESQIAFFLGLTPQSLSRCKNKTSDRVMSSQSFLLLKGLAAKGRFFYSALLDLQVEIGKEQSPGGRGSHNAPIQSSPIAAKSF